MAALRLEERAVPERITLGVGLGVPPSSKPPVRIYLASEPAQHRAERVFMWSVRQFRDPSRIYEIHLMKGLIGFARRGWTTGFTNYRYAIPHYASGEGRAIYNDVDQIYLNDPALLFDLPLEGRGYLSVAPDDPSVMLIDCQRMAKVWTLEDAQKLSKGQMLKRGAALRGPLAGEWNARDEEHRPERPGCLHYTTLHTQPWCPYPERFVYQHNTHEGLWFDLERSADAAGFQVFTAEHPSELFARLPRDAPLHQIPQEDLAWCLDARLRRAEGGLRLEIDCDPHGGVQRGPDGAREPARSADWWIERLDAAGARNPGVRWEAELRTPGGPRRVRAGGPPPDGSPPRVWVLTDDRAGNTTQSLGLAEALGLPFEHKQLVPGPLSRLHNRLLGASIRGIDPRRSTPLQPPWPDLVIAAGRRTAPVALWIREQSAGRARLVQLGRKGSDRATLFDLAVAPAYCRLFPHPRRLELHGPLHRVTAQRLAEAREAWRERLAALPAPRIALLVGGTSGQYRLDVATARRLTRDVVRRAREAGGSVLATASRRTGGAAIEAVAGELADVPHWLYRPGEAAENPYLGYLACADSFVVTADSESILAEATSLGKPVSIYPLPERPSFRLLHFFREAMLRRAVAQPLGPRATARPQQGLERFCARLIERGFVRPSRDLSLLHEDLMRRGLAAPYGEVPVPTSSPPEIESVAREVRALLGMPQ